MKGYIEIMREVVKNMEKKLRIRIPVDVERDLYNERSNVKINFLFGNAQYVKEQLDLYTKAPIDTVKFPLVVLFTPINERRDDADLYSSAKVNMLIACSSSKRWSNERRLQASFINILRPIYEALIDEIKEDGRFEIDYNDVIKHDYSENYSYGRYGAYTESGEEMSEPIDAINIRSMELKLKKFSCR